MAKQNVLSIGLISKTRPEMIYELNNGQGSFLFNHNIVELDSVEAGDSLSGDEETPATVFMYDSVRCEYPKTADNIFSTLLEARYSQKRESKLLNEFKSAELGLLDESYKEPYLDFLRDRIAIREMVDSVCSTHNIPTEL